MYCLSIPYSIRRVLSLVLASTLLTHCAGGTLGTGLRKLQNIPYDVNSREETPVEISAHDVDCSLSANRGVYRLIITPWQGATRVDSSNPTVCTASGLPLSQRITVQIRRNGHPLKSEASYFVERNESGRWSTVTKGDASDARAIVLDRVRLEGDHTLRLTIKDGERDPIVLLLTSKEQIL